MPVENQRVSFRSGQGHGNVCTLCVAGVEGALRKPERGLHCEKQEQS